MFLDFILNDVIKKSFDPKFSEELMLGENLPFIGTIYFQAQPQFQLSWAELSLVSIPPATRLHVRPVAQNSS